MKLITQYLLNISLLSFLVYNNDNKLFIRPTITNEGNENTFSGLSRHSHNKRKYSLEGNLDRVLFAVELEFRKILVARLSQNSSNVSIEYAGKSRQLYSLSDQHLGALIYLHFIILILICS